MKRSRFSEVQIANVLWLAESGTPVVDVCRQIGVSEAMYYTRKKRYGDLGARLGGFLARTGDGEPGVKTIWLGCSASCTLPLGSGVHVSFRLRGTCV